MFRLSNRQLLKYGNPQGKLILARQVVMKATAAEQPKQEGYDEHNMRIGRPLSPHLTIYRPQLTSLLSITHRATGTCQIVNFVQFTHLTTWKSDTVSVNRVLCTLIALQNGIKLNTKHFTVFRICLASYDLALSFRSRLLIDWSVTL